LDKIEWKWYPKEETVRKIRLKAFWSNYQYRDI
jgi:hypothetical protein